MDERTTLLNQVTSTLETLAGVREKMGKWVDAEVEEEEENCIFKIMEALYPFFLANHMYPVELARIPLRDETAIQDIRFVLKTISEEGFSPSPYLYVREKVEFTDTAATALKLFTMVYNYISKTDLKKKKEWGDLLGEIPLVIEKGINFLQKCGYTDKKGLRWAGTDVGKIQKKSYFNVYFTSEVAIALNFVLKFTSNSLPKTKREEVEESIRKACFWVLGQQRRNIIYGDESLIKGEINYFFYGLNCLFDCFDYLDRDQQSKTASLFDNFLEEVRKGEEELSFITYIDVPLSGYAKPIYYDDRSSIANIITILCKGRNILRRQKAFDEVFFNTLNLYRRSLLDLKDVKNDLWNKNNFLLYLNNRAIEALLYFASFGQTIVFEKLSEQSLVEALKNTLENPQIQQIFLSELNRLVTLKAINDYRPEGGES